LLAVGRSDEAGLRLNVSAVDQSLNRRRGG
jgi:hypothetical protein